MFKYTNAVSGFAVDDAKKAQEFYGGTLGIDISVVDEQQGLLVMHLAGDRDMGDRDMFVYEKPDFIPATYTILNFQVDDVGAAVDELSERGVEFERYDDFDQDEKGIASGPGPTIAWFKDPAGNILSVLNQG
jgi:predicted enzyme related to lactoylglutathione lyase